MAHLFLDVVVDIFLQQIIIESTRYDTILDLAAVSSEDIIAELVIDNNVE